MSKNSISKTKIPGVIIKNELIRQIDSARKALRSHELEFLIPVNISAQAFVAPARPLVSQSNFRIFAFFKQSMFRLTILYLILGLNWAGISAIGRTSGFLYDSEDSWGNLFEAGTLDLDLSPDSGFLPATIGKDEPSSRDVAVTDNGVLGFQYRVAYSYVSGDAELCNALTLQAKLNGSSVYSGNLNSFNLPAGNYIDPSSWNFTVISPNDFSGDKTCHFKFIFTGWQQDLGSPATGFSDTEEVSNTINYHPNQACPAQDISLPAGFDSETFDTWQNHAKEGGKVEGSFVFPNGTAGLELGPSEIVGDLIFGQSNSATIKGPLYVHGNLIIGTSTTITQDSSFGNGFATIIVEKNIYIADDVVFNGSGTTGAVLLISKAPAGSYVIDVAARVTGDGNLGDAVLFATLGNIHIGTNRTVLDAFVVATGSSGPTGPLSPSASANVDNSSGVSWSSLANSYASDDSYATVSIGSSGHSDYLETTGFGFSIDSGATITGIELSVERKVTTTDEVNDNAVRLRKNSGMVGNNKASGTQWEAAETTATYGGPGDLWGTTWSPSEINNANFGARFAAEHDFQGTDTVSVDSITIKVYWAIAGQTINNEGTSIPENPTIPSQAACGPMFAPLGGVVINEFVPNPSGGTPFAFDTDYKTPSRTYTPNDWDTNTVSNIQTSNNQYASDNDQNDQQGYSDFGFNIPSNAIIDGIEVQMEARATDSGCQVGVNLSWNNGLSFATQKNQTLSGSDTLYTLGNAVDTWGHSWTPSEFLNANFVFRLQNIDPGSGCFYPEINYVDLVQARVHYTVDGVAADFFTETFGTSNSTTVTGWTEQDPAEIIGTTSGEDSTRDGVLTNKFAKLGQSSGGTDGYICRSINASGLSGLTLHYYWVGDSDAESDDDGVVEYFTSGTCGSPTGLSTLATHALNNTLWSSLQNINLPSSLNNSIFFIRFRNDASQTNEYFRVDQVIISSYAPVDQGIAGGHSSGNGGEWVELYNGSGSSANVDGWKLKDFAGGEITISAANSVGSLNMAPDGFLVVYRDGDADFDLGNVSDTLYLYDGLAAEKDHHDYDYGSEIPINKSFARIPDGTANWIDPDATPGRPNLSFVVPYVEPIEPVVPEELVMPEEILPSAETADSQTIVVYICHTDETTGDSVCVLSDSPDTALPVQDSSASGVTSDTGSGNTQGTVSTPETTDVAETTNTPEPSPSSEPVATDEPVAPEESAAPIDTLSVEQGLIVETPTDTPPVENPADIPAENQPSEPASGQPASESLPPVVEKQQAILTNSNPDPAPDITADVAAGSAPSGDGNGGGDGGSALTVDSAQ